MSFMFELLYKPPVDKVRERKLTKQVSGMGGRLDFREDPSGQGYGPVVLTFDFDDYDKAFEAAKSMRQQGEHVDGPYSCGP
jgi:hypothetical protein